MGNIPRMENSFQDTQNKTEQNDKMDVNIGK